MTVIASGEIDLKLSPKSQAALQNDLAKVGNQAGSKSGSTFSDAFTSKAKGLTGSVAKSINEISSQGLTAGVAAAGAAIAGFAAASIRNFTEAAPSVRAFQRVTGESAKEASHFVSAFDDMGISAGAATNAMGKLAQQVGAGGQKLTELGVAIAHTKAGNVDLKETFLNIAESVAGTEDPVKRVNIAVAAFGKTGKDLLPILQQGRAGIEALFKSADLNFSQKQLDSAERYRLAMDQLDDNSKKLQNTLGSFLVPELTAYAESANDAADSSKSWKERIGDLLFGVKDQKTNTEQAAISQDKLAQASVALGVQTDQLSGKTKDQVIALLDERKALDAVTVATLAGFDAGFAYQDSLNAQKDAAVAVTEKQTALNEAIRDHGVKSAEASVASDQLQRALLAQQESALRSSESMGRLAEQNLISSGATDTTTGKLDAQIASLERSKGQIDSRNIPAIQAMIDRLKELKADYSPTIDANTAPATQKVDALARHIKSVFAGLTVSGSFLGLPNLNPAQGGPNLSAAGRAGGGPYGPGPLVTGEKGWELQFPKVGGRVISHQDAISAIQSAAGGGDRPTVGVLNVYEVAQDPQATAFAVSARLGESSQR